ncbi:uncharacterized protein [Rutidosis leptorrhynchoides]|uniref:uncharacterized protein n=1 Tax=Rutidosis leptorrhynchoides TaxID=125765 RepID=UPI003A994E6D
MNTACFTQNRSLVVKRHQKTAYEVLTGRRPSITFLHVFGTPGFILNNRDQLGIFDAKVDEGIFLGYPNMSKAYRVYNKRIRCIEESINVTFDENVPTLSSGQEDDELIFEESTQQTLDEEEPTALPSPIHHAWLSEDELEFSILSVSKLIEPTVSMEVLKIMQMSTGSAESQFGTGSTEEVQHSLIVVHTNVPTGDSDVVCSATSSPVHNTKWTKEHPIEQIIGKLDSRVKTRRHATSNFCMNVNFVSTIEPTNVEEVLKDPSWAGAMQDELFQFDRNKVWKLVPEPDGDEKKIIGTKWVFKNKI